jgi:hypothetical protein
MEPNTTQPEEAHELAIPEEVTPVDEPTDEQPDEQPTAFDRERMLRLIETIENELRALRQMAAGGLRPHTASSQGSSLSNPVGFMPSSHDAGIDGIFDGEKMVDAEGKSYQVPPNYASKSKLIEGDPLKLYITHDGKYVYKQLGPIPRMSVPGTLRQEGSRFVVDADDGTTYNILTACVTYYMSLYGLQQDGRVMIMIPAAKPSRWAVLDNVL